MTARIKGYNGQTMISLGRYSVVPGAKQNYKIPQDVIGKEVIAVLNGVIIPTFAAQKPIVRPNGIADGLIKNVIVSRSGSDKVKSLSRLRKALHNNKQVFGEACPMVYHANSATLGQAALTGLPVLPATTQSLAYSQSWVLAMFENKLSSSYANTLFDTRGLQTANIEVEFGALADIQDPTDVANVGTFTQTSTLELFLSCADYLVDVSLPTADWVETSQSEAFTGAADRVKKYFQPEGELQGMLVSVLKTGDIPVTWAEMQTIKFELNFDGTKIFEGDMLSLAQFNNNKCMKDEIEKGSFYWSFLHNSSYGSGLPVGDGKGSKPLEMYITIPGAIGACEVVLEYDKIVVPRQSEAVTKK